MNTRDTDATPLSLMYASYLSNIPEDDLFALSHFKRAYELFAGVPAFRQDVRLQLDDLQSVAYKYKLPIDLEALMPWLCLRFPHRYLPIELSERYAHQLDNPLFKKWLAHRKFLLMWRESCRQLNDCSDQHLAFHAWRKRQMALCDDTLKSSAQAITHPSFAFELSEGCSVGCWFCGLSAESYRGYFPYNEKNKKFWREILHLLKETFGIHAMQSAFCYWATEPTDNPDYISFIKDFYAISGILPQTTLAMPVKNIDWTRALLRLAENSYSMINRFSILTLKQLQAVHDAFTPREMFGVELVMQHKQAQLSAVKSASGHAFKYAVDNENSTQKKQLGLDDGHSTIACVSGFLINLCQKRIQLVSPRAASEDYPSGYKVHGERQFETLEDVDVGVASLVEQHMPLRLPKDQTLCFRGDLTYEENKRGFSLISSSRQYHVRHGECARIMGKLIHAAKSNATDLIRQAVAQGANVMKASWLIEHLFCEGLLSDN